MTRIENLIRIEAPLDTVWEILTDPTRVPTLYPDAVSIEVDPPGRSAVGQRYRITGKAGRRKLEILVELAELVPKSRIVTENRPGGLFKSFAQTILIEPAGETTEVKLVYEYEVSIGYIGKLLNELLIERLVKDNIQAYAKNLKGIAELLPID